jgi:DNA-binding phage protein
MPTSIDYKEYLIESLKDRRETLGYLNACLEDPDPRVFAAALRNVAAAQGVTRAKKASKLLPKRGMPDLQQLGAVLASLGLRLTVEKNRAA